MLSAQLMASFSACQTDWWDFFFYFTRLFSLFLTGKQPLKRIPYFGNTAMSFERYCLFSPLPRGWNTNWSDWKPFPFILKWNSSQRAAAWLDEARTIASRVFRLYLTLHLSQPFKMSLCLPFILIRFSSSSVGIFSQSLSAGKHMNTCRHSWNKWTQDEPGIR